MRRPFSALAVSVAGACALAALPVLVPAGPALATPAAPTAPTATAAVRDQSISGTASAMWQTDQRVEDMVYSSRTRLVYASGPFTQVRPPAGGAGAATGRTFLAAFSGATGALATGFNVVLDGQPEALALSPAGGVLYIAGDFTTVNGVARRGLAAVDAATGRLRTEFTADLDGDATALGVGRDGVFVSGRFGTVNGTAKTRLARVNASSGAVVDGFTASLDAPALAIDLAPVSTSADRLLVGGNFTTVNGAAPSGMAALDPLTGAARPWAANQTEPINGACSGRVTDIAHNDTVPATVVVAGEGEPGCWEGTYAASALTGELRWNSPCAGATQAVTIIGTVVYKASHEHDCAFTRGDARGGFVGGVFNRDLEHYHLTAQSVTDGSFRHWTPDTNSSVGADNVTQVGPRAAATDGTHVFVGGDFTTVNGRAQQGLTRFTAGSTAGPARPAAPAVRATAAGRLTVTWAASSDADSGTLTYTLYRGATAVYRTTVESYPWSRPVMRYDDSVAPGTTPTYYVQVSDGTHAAVRSTGAAATSSSFRPAAYAATTAFLDPVLYYRMDTTSDYSGGGNTMIETGTAAARPVAATGAVDRGRGRQLSGGAYATSTSPLTLTTFSQAVWFRTTSTTGGTLMAMSTQRTGAGGVSDRALMLDNNGNVAFQARRTGADSSGLTLRVARNQGPTYRDGRWHLAVGTYDGTFLRLYVDGVYQTGIAITPLNDGVPLYTRIGYVDTSNFRSVLGSTAGGRAWPATPYLNGWVDDAAVYDRALSGGDVRALFAAGVAHPGEAAPVTQPPAATVPTSCFGRKPTIVDRDGGTVVGTKRADVIVTPTNRRSVVAAKGGNDLVCGASTVKGGKGRDRITYAGGAFPAVLKGGPGNDSIKGGPQGDTVSGGGGADTLKGAKGNDTLNGGPGRDVGNGGAGVDRCIGVERARRCE